MRSDTIRSSVGLLLAFLLLVFNGARSAEIFHPVEEMGQAHHSHQSDVLDGPHVHESHSCIHLQKVEPAAANRDQSSLEQTDFPLMRPVLRGVCASISSIPGRSPPQFARS